MEHDSNYIKFPLVKPLPHHFFDPDAIRVYRRLRHSHYLAYFVGGCVRDLLLGFTPKDFDLVTSARPRQVRRMFSNSRVIGRRFLLVNVFFGKKVVEVSTFRKTPWMNGTPGDGEKMLIQDDNQFGSDEEDAMRRDFTINALFYTPDEREVVDYVDGIDDLQQGKIRTIGDPKVRFAEDPVRIIRALKFAARLNFDIIKEAYEAIPSCCSALQLTPSARILLELMKILHEKNVFACFDLMAKTSVLSVIAPEINKLWSQNDLYASNLLKNYLKAMESFHPETVLTDATLTSALCLPMIVAHIGKRRQNNKGMINISEDYIDRSLDGFAKKMSFSRRMLQKVKSIIYLQIYLEKKRKHPYMYGEDFMEALDFLKLRVQAGDAPADAHHYWTSVVRMGNKKEIISE